MAKRLNLPTILKHLDLRNLQLYEVFRSYEDDRKELDRMLAYLIPLWMCGTDNPREQIQIAFAFNRHINENWWELDRHPELRAKLLAATGLGHVVRHDYQARPKRKITALTDLLMRRYPDIRKDEVQIWCSTNSESSLVQLCQYMGIQENDRDTIISEYRNIVC